MSTEALEPEANRAIKFSFVVRTVFRVVSITA
jgi:hypothetical protein